MRERVRGRGSYQLAPQPRFQEGIEAVIIQEDFILIK